MYSEIPFKIFSLIIGVMFILVGYTGVSQKKLPQPGIGYMGRAVPSKFIKGPLAQVIGFFLLIIGISFIAYSITYISYLTLQISQNII